MRELNLLQNYKISNLWHAVFHILVQGNYYGETQKEMHLEYDGSAFLGQSTLLEKLGQVQVWIHGNHTLLVSKTIYEYQVLG